MDRAGVILIAGGGALVLFMLKAKTAAAAAGGAGGGIATAEVGTFLAIDSSGPAIAQEIAQSENAIANERAIDLQTGREISMVAGAVTTGVLVLPAFGTTSAVTGASVGLMSATSATIIGAAVAGVILLVITLRSTTHLLANEFVQHYQNPYGAALAAIVDAKDKALNAGIASGEDIRRSLNAVKVIWAKFNEICVAFAARGSGYAIVVKQAHTTLDGLMAQIMADMDRQATALGA